VQLLDGIGPGGIGALFPVVVADLTRGAAILPPLTGVVRTVQGIGGVISMAIAGRLVVQAGYDVAFFTLGVERLRAATRSVRGAAAPLMIATAFDLERFW
jgi:hypothetical protein